MSANTAAASDQVKKLKRRLELWREAVLPLYAVLIWEKPWHPGLLTGISTSFFLLFWYIDPSVLTTLAFMGLVVNALDYAIYLFGSYARHPDQGDKWTGKDEKKLEEVCQSVVSTQVFILSSISKFFQMRNTRTKTYYAVTILSLTILAFVGNMINNLFLTYLVVTFILLLPGMKHQGLLQQWKSTVMGIMGSSKDASKKTD
ncbi:ADP-ribosylation factor-like protein 6-interacting protein 1 [Frankliniella fusca]|uniref:ADP-ribosylation factor-like protein 6-interacting protein 1 n=1 Tax=Frankliniella fusca TaxID=407009 RepID=A0AAE1I0B4_9NEOP|nr:ADP-ribosylation factor-like protein 6-interacting protein 1 [Frankliniella fusca]